MTSVHLGAKILKKTHKNSELINTQTPNISVAIFEEKHYQRQRIKVEQGGELPRGN